MTDDKEMRKALEADGEKLRQLTGQDHGPYFIPSTLSNEPTYASGTLMTYVDCLNCQNVFDVEGDAEGEEVECPDCNTKMIVRRT